jgi:hypothetical protein
MKSGEEHIIYPRPKEITSLPVRQVLPFLVELWDRQLKARVVDFDRLFGAGQLTRQMAIPGVESELRDWLQSHSEHKQWDIAGCFLMGYWRGERAADRTLITLLLASLEHDRPTTEDDSVICALGAAYDLCAPEIASMIKECFRRLWRPGATYQPGVASSLKHVLRFRD